MASTPLGEPDPVLARPPSDMAADGVQASHQLMQKHLIYPTPFLIWGRRGTWEERDETPSAKGKQTMTYNACQIVGEH